jgi:hypothetical protein
MALLQDLEMLRVSSSPNLIKSHFREINKPVEVNVTRFQKAVIEGKQRDQCALLSEIN